jgi:acetyl-CoA carboxylase biotin carboxyl carrier protein
VGREDDHDTTPWNRCGIAGFEAHRIVIESIGGRGRLFSGPSRINEEAAEMPDVEAHITGTVWKIECAVGDTIEEGDTVAILESMKMEMPVEAEDSGTVTEIRCQEGQAVNEGDTLVVLE